MGILEFLANSEPILQTIDPVNMLFLLQAFMPPITYGVLPEADIPITESFEDILCFIKSSQA